MEVCAHREVNLRAKVNDATKAVMLAFAQGNDLDHISARYSVERRVIDPGDPNAVPPIDPTYEDDETFRLRTQLAPEAMTTAGSDGSYTFNDLSAGDTPSAVEVDSPVAGKIVVIYTFDPNGFSAKVKDASATSPTPGDVVVTVLSRVGDGTADQALIDAVTAHLSGKYVRPLNDNLTVQSATIINFVVDATLDLYDGPDSAVVIQQATDAVNAYVSAHHKLGDPITESGLKAALTVSGVKKVTLTKPAADVTPTEAEAAYCTGVTLTIGGAV